MEQGRRLWNDLGSVSKSFDPVSGMEYFRSAVAFQSQTGGILNMMEASRILDPILTNFSVLVLRFQAAFIEEGWIAPPEDENVFLGDALRGGLGRQLGRISCRGLGKDPSQPCPDQCQDASDCAYRALYRPVPASDVLERPPLKGLSDRMVPRPYALRFDPLPGSRVAKGQVFRFSISLVGCGTLVAPSVVEAISRLERSGVGREGYRKRFRVISVTQALPWTEQILCVYGSNEPVALPSALPLALWASERASEGDKLEVSWSGSPLDLLLKNENDRTERVESAEQLTAELLLNSAFYRLWFLSALWCGGSPPVEGAAVALQNSLDIQRVGLGRSVRCSYWRKSRQERNDQHMQGVMTSVLFAGNIAPLHYLLSLARPLGIGQKTTSGFGQYDLRLISH